MKHLRLCLAAASLLAASQAMADDNPLTILTSSEELNVADIAVAGHGNTLTLLQETPLDATMTNTIRLHVEGDGNGGPAGSAFDGAALSPGLTPGNLTQMGEGNLVDIGVFGANNLFAMAQLGDGNVISAAISGIGNQATVQQFGNNNLAVFSQTGNGNNVSIIQRLR